MSGTSGEGRTVAVTITGRVQGVSYRAWTAEEARRLGLSGHVRNRDDGAVEAVFGGSPEAVARMVERCWSGPPGAHVTDVRVGEGAEPPDDGFEIRRG